jgi:RHH-type proline utilization regulon transcriptional repressor/proline dehydrogenase/delta 1-pyrroline-5-carboxylate dehydrogenase
MGRYRPGLGERVEDWLLTHAVADSHFRTRMLRFLDVLAAFEGPGQSREVARLFREYFGGDFPGIPAPLRSLLSVARSPHVPASVLASASRRSAGVFAGRFITNPSPAGTRDLIDELAALGRTPSFDLLGEAVLSEREAEAYEARYLALIADLAGAPQARQRTGGGEPALQVSLKLSSLTHHFSPVDMDGSVERVLPRLTRIARAARAAGVGLAVDAEQYATRDVVWSAFQRAFGRGTSLGDWPDAGFVVQSYLRDAEAHVAEVVAFARDRGTSFQVRLVKGAYWDYEMAVAAANRWTSSWTRAMPSASRSRATTPASTRTPAPWRRTEA